MTPFPHRYSARVRGGPSVYAELTANGLTALRTAPPAQFGGPGDAWSPEQLLLAAVETCFLFTFRVVARLSKLDFVNLDLAAEGTVDRKNGIAQFTEIVLSAALVVTPGTDQVKARAALERTKSACLVSASLSTPVRLEVNIREAELPRAMPMAS